MLNIDNKFEVGQEVFIIDEKVKSIRNEGKKEMAFQRDGNTQNFLIHCCNTKSIDVITTAPISES